MSAIERLRQEYHREICKHVIFMKLGDKPSMADVASDLSVRVSRGLLQRLNYPVSVKSVEGQTAGQLFEQITRGFLEEAFGLIKHLRPGQWQFSVHGNISDFDQYKHILELSKLVLIHKELRTTLGDYVIQPDIIVSRSPISDEDINSAQVVVDRPDLPKYTPLRLSNAVEPILHASISCKWTLRSDRSQNARTEALNLIRNRKGHTPHIVAITGEPMPTRISSLAMGTGDIDCVYHIALHELVDVVKEIHNEAASETLNMLIDGRRLRDISDLPFDLAI